MNGKDIGFLITLICEKNKQNEITLKRELADKLDISVKTLHNWITDPAKMKSKIGRPYVAYLRRIFEPLLIVDRLKELENTAFDITPSELICFWIVCGTEVILLKDSVRVEPAESKHAVQYTNDEIHKRLSDESITVNAIQTAQAVNLHGPVLHECVNKNAPHIVTSYLSKQMCYSLLKIPLVVRSVIGPRVIGLIELENKLSPSSGGVRKPIDPTTAVEPSAYPCFTEKEENVLRSKILNEYNKKLSKIMAALDYLEPDTSPQFIFEPTTAS